MEKQLRVTKADGSTEPYLHTKVIGAINNALSAAGRSDMAMAEDLADVVTYYLYHRRHQRTVGSSEILSMIKAVLTATGHEGAALALSEHTLDRRLKRVRTEVLAVKVHDFEDVERLCQDETAAERMPWDKAQIVHDLTECGIPQPTARAIAAMVEERVFNMGLTTVPLSLIKQLVLGETATALRAQRELQTT